MSRGLRVVLSVLGLGLLTLLMYGGMDWWVRSHMPEQAATDAVDREGAEFGSRSDDRGCLNEVFARYAAKSDITSSMMHGDFLRACLRNARRTGDFCAITEPRWNWRLARWTERACDDAGVSGSTCDGMLRPMERHCDRLIEKGEWTPGA